MYLVVLPPRGMGGRDLWAFFHSHDGLTGCGYPARQVRSFIDVARGRAKEAADTGIVLAEKDDRTGVFQSFPADAVPAGWTVQRNATGALFTNWAEYIRDLPKNDGT